jgi:hypothetical protein
MKRLTALFLILVLGLMWGIAAAGTPEEKAAGCPAEKAGQQGKSIFKDLHDVMAPAWHEAYPEKNVAAIREAIGKFETMIPRVKEYQPAIKLAARQEKFNAAKAKFLDYIVQGKTGNDSVVLNNMPDMHTNFEMMAHFSMPAEFKEYESFKTVVNLMIDTHLKNGDFAAIGTSLEALQMKDAMLQKAELPEDFKPVEADAKAQIASLGAGAKELSAACAAKDNKKIEETLKKLKEACDIFDGKYI